MGVHIIKSISTEFCSFRLNMILIAVVGDFCERAWWLFENYPCHIDYQYDEKKIKIFMHYNNAVCPFDAIEVLDTLKLEFKNLTNWSSFYVRQRQMTKYIDKFSDELELISFNLDQ